MKRFAIAVLTVFIAMTAASSAQAQANLFDQPLGSLYLSASEAGHVDTLQELAPFTNFFFYLVADIDFAEIGQEGQNLTNGISAWEAQATLPTQILILGATLAPATSLDVGSVTGSVYDFVVGTGTTASVGDPFTLVTFQGFISDAGANFTETATLAPVTSPSVPGEAVWVEAQPLNGCTIGQAPENCIFRFANLGDLTLSTGIDNDSESFGSMKARF